MPFGLPAFPSSSGTPRLPEDPNHRYWKQQAKNANPPPQQYRDDPMSSMRKETEKETDVEYRDRGDVKRDGREEGDKAGKEKKEVGRKKTD